MVLPVEQASEGASRDVRDPSTTPARVELCEVIDVDNERHQVEVWSEFSNKRIPDVEVTCLYCHPDGEDGLYLMPEPGAQALVLFTSDGNEYLLGFFMPTSESRGARGIRPEMNPGDMVLSTRDQNHVILRRGGVIEIASTPLCQRFYLPMGNLIHDVFEQWKGSSIVGEFSWLHDPVDPEVANNDPEKEVKVLYTWKTREYVQDENASVIIQAGHVDDEEGYIRLEVKAQGTDQTLVLRILKDGSLEAALKGHIKVEVEAEIEVLSNQRIKLTVGKAEILMDRSGQFVLRADTLIQEVASRATMRAKEIVLDGVTKIGGPEASYSLMRAETFIPAFLSHTHAIAGAGTGGAIVAPNNEIVSPKVKVT